MIIPFQQLSAGALQSIIEEFITRQGTDYGEVECSLDEKVAQIRQMLKRREVVIAFDPQLQTTSVLPALEAQAIERDGGGEHDG